MTDSEKIIRTITLRGRRYDETAVPREATITTDSGGCVYFSIPDCYSKRHIKFAIDFSDVDQLFSEMRAAAVEAQKRLLETITHASASAVIYTAQQAAART